MEDAFSFLTRRLSPIYGAGEARAIALVLLEDAFGLSRTDIFAGKGSAFSEDARLRLVNMCKRLEEGEPVQQVVGFAWFAGRRFKVGRDVLTPRPETEELLRWALEGKPCGSVLDACTGSGCIGISIALECPAAQVTACDISSSALSIARSNAAALGAEVRFSECDVLKNLPPAEGAYSLIVSNPPYVCEREKGDMERNVLNYEPHLALFVPDNDPLLFYRALAVHAAGGALRQGGTLLVEANCAFAADVARLFTACGLRQAQVRRDQFGKERMVAAVRE